MKGSVSLHEAYDLTPEHRTYIYDIVKTQLEIQKQNTPRR